ncbi:MAG TPA: hypothetical protein VFR07_01930 [Mycobacteriales bacterium]|jgi:hypothetical protein|nr:hypothetical protein [Mycobacteriales bacterium]
MATVTVVDNVVSVRLSPMEKLAGLLRDLAVPTSQVRRARAVADGLPEVVGMRAPGLHLPGTRKYGTWRRRSGRTYAAVRGSGPALLLELDGHRYDSVVVTTPDAERLAQRIAGS